MCHSRIRLLHLAALATALGACCSLAQAQQNTSATYDDWILQCQNETTPAPRKLCQISQVSRIRENNTPFSRVLVEKPASGKPVIFVAQLPVNVSVRAPVSLRLDDSDPGISTTIERCVPAGCFVEFEFKDDYQKKARSGEGIGKLTFKDAGGHDIVVPLSFKGYRPAFDALLKE